MMRPLTLTLTLLILALAALPAGASGAVSVGLGDHGYGAFGDPRFGSLGLKKARVIVPWNVALRAGDRRNLDDWLGAARANGIDPFVTFGASYGSRCPAKPCKLPSIGEFRKAVRVFRRTWPQVRTIGVWNEANHRTQPTFRHPDRAAAVLPGGAKGLPKLQGRGSRRDRRPEHGPLARRLPQRSRAARGSGACTTTATPTPGAASATAARRPCCAPYRARSG